jgi:hypothetical protein
MKKLRSNSKEVKAAIRLHLVEISQNDDVKVETVDQAIKYITNRFYIEMIKHNKHYTNNIKVISYQEIFTDWLNGLALHTYYTYTDIINYLNSIGLYAKDEKQEQEKAADLYYYLIFREVKDYIYKIINKGDQIK